MSVASTAALSLVWTTGLFIVETSGLSHAMTAVIGAPTMAESGGRAVLAEFVCQTAGLSLVMAADLCLIRAAAMS